jgi:predicted alpha/beta hydrolase family esterase
LKSHLIGEKIENSSEKFVVFHSDDDPWVGMGNGEKIAKELHVKMNFVPNAGHFNKSSGYVKFPKLLEKIKEII